MIRNLHRRFVSGRTLHGRLVNGAWGDNPATEVPYVPLDPVSTFGAVTQYQPNVKDQFRQYPFSTRYPWTLRASNRVSEHNIFNAYPIIQVTQLAGQTQSPDYRRIVSRRIRLPQSMQGGA
jgi:hypothetical protein